MDDDEVPFHLGFEDVQAIMGHVVDDFGWGDDSSSDDSRDHLINNSANIARGFSNISSPEEDIIKSRGRINKKIVDERPSSQESVLLRLATRKSPRKPIVRTVNDFADDYFKSPTPKKARGTPKKNSKITPIKSSKDYKANPKKAAFRKRLTLNSGDSRPESSSPRVTERAGSSNSQSQNVSSSSKGMNSSSSASETSPSPLI